MFRRKLHISLAVIGLYVSDPRCWKEPGIPGTTFSTLEIASCNVISPDAVNLTDRRENGGSVNIFKFLPSISRGHIHHCVANECPFCNFLATCLTYRPYKVSLDTADYQRSIRDISKGLSGMEKFLSLISRRKQTPSAKHYV